VRPRRGCGNGRDGLHRRRDGGTVALGAYERTRCHVGAGGPPRERTPGGSGTRRNGGGRRQPRGLHATKHLVLAGGDGEVGSFGGAAIEREHGGEQSTCTTRSIPPCRCAPRNYALFWGLYAPLGGPVIHPDLSAAAHNHQAGPLNFRSHAPAG
jgi:hypothetical protein